MDHLSKKAVPEDPDHGTERNSAIYWKRHRHLTRSLAIAANLLIFWAILPPFIRTALFHGLLAHQYLASMLFLFGLLSLSLVWSTGQLIDAWVFLYFNFRGERPLWLDRIMLGFTQLGTGITGMLLGVVLFLVDNHHLAYEIILGTLILWLTVEAIKAVFRRSRPFIKLTQTRIIGSRARGRSFPSGHTSQSFFIAAILIQHFQLDLWVAILLYALASLVGVTRMYVGAHYPRDILAGVILGSVWGALGGIVDAHFFGGFR